MSSGYAHRTTKSDKYFLWNSQLDSDAYTLATYQLRVNCDPDQAAIGMAMEQSTTTLQIPGYVEPDNLATWTVRVVKVTHLADCSNAQGASSYQLATNIYAAENSQLQEVKITLAFPIKLLQSGWVQWQNILIGELPRLGFIQQFQLLEATPIKGLGSTPGWGINGIRSAFGVDDGAILCRSMRPAVGLDLQTMIKLNRDVLEAGFHCVKDDELQFFPTNKAFETHINAMVKMRDQATNKTAEKKNYLANLICEPQDLEARWSLCVKAGVDGVLIAPSLQGIATLNMLAARRELPILAHNSGAELNTRYPHWRVHETVMAGWLRHAGADWIVTSGGFADHHPNTKEESDLIHAIQGADSKCRASMPILQGGKQPQHLLRYTESCKSSDYMLIVAHWIDSHPKGIQYGAKAFRDAVEAQR